MNVATNLNALQTDSLKRELTLTSTPPVLLPLITNTIKIRCQIMLSDSTTFCCLYCKYKRHDRSFVIATRLTYWTIRRKNSAGARYFLALREVYTLSGSLPISYSLGTLFYPVVRLARPGVYQPPPSSTEVKNEWIYASTNPLCLHDEDKENFTFSTTVKLPVPVAARSKA